MGRCPKEATLRPPVTRMLTQLSKEEWAALPPQEGDPLHFCISDDFRILFWPEPARALRIGVLEMSVIVQDP
jgi:hypothetical protein